MSTWIALRRTLLVVSGPDARDFLQGLLTQDMDKLRQDRVIYAALLSPQGKVITDMFVWALRDGDAMLDVDPNRRDELMRRLSMYKLRSRLSITDIGETMGVVASQVASSPRDPRFLRGELGGRELLDFETLPAINEELYDQWRLTLGVPDLARDAQPEEVFAGEALLEELNGVDFSKGCFVGQENVSRMKRRATTRKKFCPIVFEGEAIAYGTPVLAGEAEIGSVRTGLPGRAIALLRLDRALAAIDAGRSLTAGGREVRLDPPPWLILPQREQAPG